MKDWCLEHPWMTFFILGTLCDSVVSIVKCTMLYLEGYKNEVI